MDDVAIRVPPTRRGQEGGRALAHHGCWGDALCCLAAGPSHARLVACVNMIPAVESMYRWEGEVQTDEELLLMAKTRSALVNDIAKRVTDLHPYDLPEVIAAPIAGGLQGYLDWVVSSTKPMSAPSGGPTKEA